MKKIVSLLLLSGCVGVAQAQIKLGDGQLSGSFETNSVYYASDSGMKGYMVDKDQLSELDPYAPEDRFGSNNYLKLDYSLGRFSAGIQMEGYLPPLQGFDLGKAEYGPVHKFILATKYVRWQDRNFTIHVGDIFDQFGNGLIFRSYEDRALGFNNSVEGVQGTYSFSNYVRVKGMYGRPRLYTDYAGSWVRGLDLSVSLSDIAGWNSASLALEGSYVNRYESLKDENGENVFETQGLTNGNLDMYSARLNLDWKGLTFRGEYVDKLTKDLPAESSMATKGNAIFTELGYNHKRLGVSATFRRLENMGVLATIYGHGSGNVLNYLPALTRQYTYLLTNLNPYVVNVEGEQGGQFDLYYSIRNKSDRSKWWNFHGNFSTYYTLKDNGRVKENALTDDDKEAALLWRDVNVDVERQWNRKLKTTLLWSRQERNPGHVGEERMVYTSNIFVADVTYKFNKKSSLHAELQYLMADYRGANPDDYENFPTSRYEGDWVAGLLEFSFAPSWSIYVSDMWNYDKSNLHYYNGGFSYTKSRTRVQLSYGRNREGWICSGGVCRYQPAYTGLNLVLTSSF